MSLLPLFLFIGILTPTTNFIYAKDMSYVYPPPESVNDIRYLYHWDLLKLALERTKKSHGPFVLKPASEISNKSRQLGRVLNLANRI